MVLTAESAVQRETVPAVDPLCVGNVLCLYLAAPQAQAAAEYVAHGYCGLIYGPRQSPKAYRLYHLAIDFLDVLAQAAGSYQDVDGTPLLELKTDNIPTPPAPDPGTAEPLTWHARFDSARRRSRTLASVLRQAGDIAAAALLARCLPPYDGRGHLLTVVAARLNALGWSMDRLVDFLQGTMTAMGTRRARLDGLELWGRTQQGCQPLLEWERIAEELGDCGPEVVAKLTAWLAEPDPLLGIDPAATRPAPLPGRRKKKGTVTDQPPGERVRQGTLFDGLAADED
jgi:hypothetical protein